MQIIKLLRAKTPLLGKTELVRFVGRQLDYRMRFLDSVKNHGSPLYVIDTDALEKKAIQFQTAFSAVIPGIKIFYAFKSNSHPLIASTLVKKGFGIDVSSGLELKEAMEAGAQNIIFSGPGKTEEELEFAVSHFDRVTILMDSFSELEKLQKIARDSEKIVRAGVRLTTDETSIWKKFGIPPSRLGDFFAAAGKCNNVDLCGLQFHLSWNLNAKAQVSFIKRLADVLQNLNTKYRQAIKFVDIGGGFWPEHGEWLQMAATPRGMLQNASGQFSHNPYRHFRLKAESIDEFASGIAKALKNNFPNDMNYDVFAEPGRWLCNDAMHILLTVIDKKSPELVVTDGGINAVGWERFESDYFPVINLSRPGLEERECLVAGSLCTPHDIWGYSYFGEDIKAGDILLVPNQGAYTYSLRQEFIKPIPKSVILELQGQDDSETEPADMKSNK